MLAQNIYLVVFLVPCENRRPALESPDLLKLINPMRPLLLYSAFPASKMYFFSKAGEEVTLGRVRKILWPFIDPAENGTMIS